MTTTTISVLRPIAPDEGVDRIAAAAAADPASPITVASGLRAHIGSPAGSEQSVGGNEETVAMHMTLFGSFELLATDSVYDERNQRTYSVTSAVLRDELGPKYAHSQVELLRVRGLA